MSVFPAPVTSPQARYAGEYDVQLSFAADESLLFLARLATTALAAHAQFDYAQIEDLRLATEELCIILTRTQPTTARLSLHLQVDPAGTFTVEATLEAPTDLLLLGNLQSSQSPRYFTDMQLGHGLDPDVLSEQILDSLTDAHHIEFGPDGVKGWLELRRRP